MEANYKNWYHKDLYNNPKFLILDEATSAIDTKIESEIMNTVDSLSKDITIIMIAHRLNTLKKCDKIIEIKVVILRRNIIPQNLINCLKIIIIFQTKNRLN